MSTKNNSSHSMNISLFCTVGDIAFEGFFDPGFYNKGHLTFEPHFHAQYEIHAVCEGTYALEMLESDDAKTLKKGIVALISPGVYHNCKIENENENEVLKYSLRIEANCIKNTAHCEKIYYAWQKALLDLGQGISLLLIPDALDHLGKIHGSLRSDDSDGILIAEAYFKLFMTKLVLMVLKKTGIQEAKYLHRMDFNNSNVRKRLIERFLQQNYPNPELSIEMLAKHLNLGIRQIRRIIMNYYGTSPYQLLVNIRLNSAKKLLLGTQLSINDIALKVGYYSSSGLLTAFKSNFGISPSEFRAQNKKKDVSDL